MYIDSLYKLAIMLLQKCVQPKEYNASAKILRSYHRYRDPKPS